MGDLPRWGAHLAVLVRLRTPRRGVGCPRHDGSAPPLPHPCVPGLRGLSRPECTAGCRVGGDRHGGTGDILRCHCSHHCCWDGGVGGFALWLIPLDPRRRHDGGRVEPLRGGTPPAGPVVPSHGCMAAARGGFLPWPRADSGYLGLLTHPHWWPVRAGHGAACGAVEARRVCLRASLPAVGGGDGLAGC